MQGQTGIKIAAEPLILWKWSCLWNETLLTVDNNIIRSKNLIKIFPKFFFRILCNEPYKISTKSSMGPICNISWVLENCI